MNPQSESPLQPWILFKKLKSRLLFGVFFLLLVSTESQFLVKTLPGLLGDLPFTLETGYIGVGESDDVQLFYYFIESEKNPKDDPLMLWITGGPGCSVLSGLLYEIGPFTINYANSTFEEAILEINPYSWTKGANVIFLDHPTGSGFSYGKTPEAYKTNDTLSTMYAYHFLRKWLVDHPKFLSNPLYIGGDSYSGIVVPMIVHEIYNGNEVGEGPQINIKGYVLGNPSTDRSGDDNSKIPFAHRMGLLSDEIYESTKENCHGEYLNVDSNNSPCIHDLQVVAKCLERIRTTHILEPFCDTLNALKSHHFRRGLRSLDKTSVDILSSPQFQIQGMTTICTHIYGLIAKTCERLFTFVSGDHDMVVPYLGTLKWIESLNLLVMNHWRPWFVDEQVAGYTMKYSNQDYNLTFATIKGGGHTAPEYKPKECLAMLMRWLANDAL